MATYRVKSSKFAHTDFEPTNNKPKVLRWFQRETPYQYNLRVEDVQEDGSFVLRANAAYAQPFVQGGNTGHTGLVVGSLDQATVDLIESPPSPALARLCDFVIFQDSPKSSARFRPKHK